MKWSTEEEFKQAYFQFDSADEQLASLKKWREHQLRVVPKFVNQIRLLANEQYSQIDHFLLELIQNADDNDYPNDAKPRLRLELLDDRLVVENNELGFTAENVFAITYAAASTKVRDKGAATFIGEKGIGFKSVFAVAQVVEVHSGRYHFELRDGEYVVPHRIDPVAAKGTRFILHLKPSLTDVVAKLSGWLSEFSSGPQEFLLFLNRLRALEVEDAIADRSCQMELYPDVESNRVRVETLDSSREYLKVSFRKEIPAAVTRSRFPDLAEDLERELIFAVPVPEGGPLERDGKLFCFLPTEVETGLPIHLQVDAKTTTNRENILDFASSEWNSVLLGDLSEQLLDVYRQLTSHADLALRLPEYWPSPGGSHSANVDLDKAISTAHERLSEEPIVLDWHGNFRTPEEVRLVPQPWSQWLYEKKYEDALRELLDAEVSFVDSAWNDRYAQSLREIGVELMCPRELVAAVAAGVPKSVRFGEPIEQRQFLAAAATLAESHDVSATDLKACPIFPLQSQEKEIEWAPVEGNVYWIQSDSPNVGFAQRTICPLFTFAPGGRESQTDEGRVVSELNKAYRNFLRDALDLAPYSEAEYLRRSVAQALQDMEGDANDSDVRSRALRLWDEAFKRGWRRRKTIVSDEGEEAFENLMETLAEGLIPTKALGGRKWQLMPVSEAFLGRPFEGGAQIAKAYAGTEVPLIQVEFLTANRSKSKLKKRSHKKLIESWCDFLSAVGAHRGAYLQEQSSVGEGALSEFQTIAVGDEDFPSLKRAVDEAVRRHPEFRADDTSSYRLSRRSSTLGLDPYSFNALLADQGHELIGGALARVWDEKRRDPRKIFLQWGNQYKDRTVSVSVPIFIDEVAGLLKISTSKGYCPPSSAFLATPFNREIAADLVPLIDTGTSEYPATMLEDLGVRRDLDVDDLHLLVREWFDSVESPARSAMAFEPYLRTVLAYCDARSDEIFKLQTRVSLYGPAEDRLLSMREWLDADQDTFFEPELGAALRGHLRAASDVSGRELVDAIFDLGDLRAQSLGLCQALAGVGRALLAGVDDDICSLFDERLRKQGLDIDGFVIASRDELPVLWLLDPPPEEGSDFITLFPIADQMPHAKRALAVLGWPAVTGMECGRIADISLAVPLSDTEGRHLVQCLHEVVRRIEVRSPLDAARIRSLGFPGGESADGVQILKSSSDVEVEIQVGSSRRIASVPYWRDRDCIVIGGDSPIQSVLPRYIDSHAGTSIAPFFDLVWVSVENRAEVEEDESDCGWNIAHPGGHAQENAGDGSKSSLDEDIFDEPGDEEGKSDERLEPPKGAPGPRRKLCSYVLPEGVPASPNGEQEGIRSKSENNSAVERAGRQKMIQIFDQIGALVVSRETENVGYDFEVSLDASTIYVELKSSEDRWSGWEHGITRNEFLKALDLGDSYYLCVVDKALSDDSQIHFIQNPAGLVDTFLFDHPWKRMGLPANVFVQRLLDAQGLSRTTA